MVLHLKIFLSLSSIGNSISSGVRNLCLILVLTFLLNAGFYQSDVLLSVSPWWYRLSSSALWNKTWLGQICHLGIWDERDGLFQKTLH